MESGCGAICSSKDDFSTLSNTDEERWSFSFARVKLTRRGPPSPWHLTSNLLPLADAADRQQSLKHSRQEVCWHDVRIAFSAGQKQIGHSTSDLDQSSFDQVSPPLSTSR